MNSAAAKSRQSCPTLCDPSDCSPPGSHPWDSPGKNTGVGYHFLLQCMKVKSESEVTQSCLTLHNSMDCSLPSSSIHGIFLARVLEWVAIAFSRWILSPTKERDYHKRKNEPRFGEDECNKEYIWLIRNSLRITLSTPWTIACQSPLPMEFSRQECWNGLPFPSPRNLPYPGIEPWSPALQADSLLSEPPGKP